MCYTQKYWNLSLCVRGSTCTGWQIVWFFSLAPRPLKKSSWELFFMNFLPIMYSVIHILFKPLQISPMWPPLIINVSSFCPVLDFLWHNTLELTAPASFRIECGHLSKHWCFLSRNCMKFLEICYVLVLSVISPVILKMS